MDINLKNKKIVCLGGGIGTSNLIRGLKAYQPDITVITSMADDGGSSGRLRKAYGIMPPGDIVSCIAAMVQDPELASLLTYRFPGMDKINKLIGGHKLGNLIMLAEIQRTGDFYKALAALKHMFGVEVNILPATDERIHLSAITKDGRRVHSETALDLAKYAEPYGLKKIYITPKKPKVNQKVSESLRNAEIIISGPGDLYTNQLPVLIIPEIKDALLQSKARKLFVLNIANKPFETKGFTLKNFVEAITGHLGTFPFDIIIANNNTANVIPKKYHNYEYIAINREFKQSQNFKLIESDLANDAFPIYHNPEKLASVIANAI